MRRLTPLIALLLLASAGGARAEHPTLAGSRVIVSNTLNGTLQFFDSGTLTESQPPLPSRGTSPGRLWVQRFEDQTFLFSANHGIEGSIGLFDLNGDLVTEFPTSPYPAGPGTVGIAAGSMRVGSRTLPMVFATNTTFALGGCGMPNGTLTAYELLSGSAVMRQAGPTIELSGPIPYAVAVDPARGQAYASSNCSDTLDTITAVTRDLTLPTGTLSVPEVERTETRATGAGPDAVIFDPDDDLIYVTNISGSSVSVFDAATPGARTTVPMPGARPIDANLADSPSGARWLVTSNGGNDSIGLVDRDIAAACAAAAQALCPEAYVLKVATGVAGGQPEGIDYDPATNRVFTVNKNIGSPSLSVIQISESGGLSGTPIARLPLGALGSGAPIPALIAFDVVVQR